jgi:hypothetical protein
MTNASIRRRFLLAGLALAAAAAAGCMGMSHASPPPPGADYAAERMSEAGRFRASWRADATPVPVGRLHTWTLHVARADGTPVTDAAIQVDGDMPQHGHGLPTRPRVTRNLGGGDYLVEGMKFQMGGWWVMQFDVEAEGQRDKVRFNLQLK